jgi:hypothetical protein
MLRYLTAALALGLATAGLASEAAAATDSAMPDEQHPRYLQIIVKACHNAETPLERINQGKGYDAEKPTSIEERKAALTALGCIDVPIPMEWMSGEMTASACRGHAGYLAAMQFLQQRQDLKEYPAVGAWGCIETDHEVVGVISQ